MTTFQLMSDPKLIQTLKDGTLEYQCDVVFILTNGMKAYNPSGVFIYVSSGHTLKEAIMAQALIEESANVIPTPKTVTDVSVVKDKIYDAATGIEVGK